ncbi:venom carboxylesterase-6 [Neodiprion lecontei]|uniref:Carboxylic ester hydrolase n=1 Tax=Neodiprion lecontei TaxID=441921 RepID=A0A6J0BZB3_NEOLC|nr:venom carboxylesterase-6 [Neodiprion lecontei]
MKFSVIATMLLGHCICLSQGETETYPTVTTPLGTIEGYYDTSSGNRTFEAYTGIPYAEPPVGDLRFEIPKAISAWSGVLSAKGYGSACVQPSAIHVSYVEKTVTGAEDCLYLHVYTPAANSSGNLLPVIFFVHGGGFQFGSAESYGPHYLLDSDVVLVTPNYRLGVFGFLSTEDATVSGNMGLKDQVIALQWVKDNIEYFGGNPESITLVGQSAGAVSVHYHYLTNLTSGLFQRGMSISGTALYPWAQTEASLVKAKVLAASLGCPTISVGCMVKCLKNQTADDIALATWAFTPWLASPMVPFGPVVEKGDANFTFIDRSPIDIITSGDVQDLPWITSGVSEDGLYPAALFIANATDLDYLNENWDAIAPSLLDFNYTIPVSNRSTVSELIKQHYLGTSEISNSTIDNFIHLMTDRLYLFGTQKAALLQADANENPVHFYYFTYRGAHSVSEYFSNGVTTNWGVAHGDDMCYAIDSFFDATTTENDKAMQKVIIKLWVSYATNGTADVGVEWNPLNGSSSNLNYLRIAGPDKLYMESNSNFGRKDFWSTINFEENIL